jgi:hypothetical protein
MPPVEIWCRIMLVGISGMHFHVPFWRMYEDVHEVIHPVQFAAECH